MANDEWPFGRDGPQKPLLAGLLWALDIHASFVIRHSDFGFGWAEPVPGANPASEQRPIENAPPSLPIRHALPGNIFLRNAENQQVSLIFHTFLSLASSLLCRAKKYDRSPVQPA